MSSSPLLALALSSLAVSLGNDPPVGSSTPASNLVWGDLDGDAFDDLLLLESAGDRLLRNLGDGQFEDVTDAALLARVEGTVAAWIVDVDTDGRRDLLRLDAQGALKLERNDGGLCFVDATAESGLADLPAIAAARLVDYDSDGRPDLVLATSEGELVLHNDQGGDFERVVVAPGTPSGSGATGIVRAGPRDETGSGSAVAGAPTTPRKGRKDRSGRSSGGGSTSSVVRVPGTILSQPGGSVDPGSVVPAVGSCASGIVDAEDAGACLPASIVPGQVGRLFPLTEFLFVSFEGNVGMGTTSPEHPVEIWDDFSSPVSLYLNATDLANPKVGIDTVVGSVAGTGIRGDVTSPIGTTIGVFGRSASDGGIGVVGENNSARGAPVGVLGRSSSTSGIGVAASLTATSGEVQGVHAQVRSPDGTAVYGLNTSETGMTHGLWGDVASPDGIAVYGSNPSTTGSAIGVLGNSKSTSGVGVKGQNDAATGVTVGVGGEVASTSGIAVLGDADATSGSTRGVFGDAASPDGIGTVGRNQATSGFAYGVFGSSASTSGVGIKGENQAATGVTVGIGGEVASTSGIAVLGDADATSGMTRGVFGDASSPDGIGTVGRNQATSGFAYGVFGSSASTSGVGIRGENQAATGVTVGVGGEVASTSGIAVLGDADATSGTTRGVFGNASSPDGVGVVGHNDATSGMALGVRGLSASPSGFGVLGQNEAASGFATGVRGEVDASATGIGVWGIGRFAGVFGRPPTGATAASIGVYGTGEDQPSHIGVVGTVGSNPLVGFPAGVSGGTDRVDGTAVNGINSATSGAATAIQGTSDSSSGEGVRGQGFVGVVGSEIAPAPGGFGVLGFATTATGRGVVGVTQSVTATSLAPVNVGVAGVTEESAGAGVHGLSADLASGAAGVLGESWSTTGGVGVHGRATSAGVAVFAEGDLVATGTKSFVHPHPEDPSRQVRFVCLEGNESGTYFRGASELVDGRATIAVPESFRLVTDPEGVTVQVTPRGAASLWVEQADLRTVVVRGTGDVPFDYFVNGIRAGQTEFEPIEPNTAYRPEVRGERYADRLDPFMRDLLVANGTLNADGTPNEQTAARLGWKLRDAHSIPVSIRRDSDGSRRVRPIEPPRSGDSSSASHTEGWTDGPSPELDRPERAGNPRAGKQEERTEPGSRPADEGRRGENPRGRRR